MTLRFFYKIIAALFGVYAVVVFANPAALRALIDPTSAAVNGVNIMISFLVFALWALLMIVVLVRTRPTLSDWPTPQPIWLGLVWLALCVSYTAFEHGWMGYRDVVYEEDGLFETATALLLLVCVGYLIAAALVRAWGQNRRLAAAILIMAAFCLLLFLEEISWGQRIFGWETPDEIGGLNTQRETNLHNMFAGYNQLIRLFVVLVIATILIGRETATRIFGRLGLGAGMPPPGFRVFRAVSDLRPHL